MAPLRRTTQAQRGHTPPLPQQACHHQKVSVAAALWKTPGGRVRLAYRTYPNQNITSEDYALFLEDLLTERLRRGPVLILHDRAKMHQGPPLEGLDSDYPRLLGFELLPAYAPELNPVEELWNWLKYDELANFAPTDVAHLDRVIHRTLFPLHYSQPRLWTFLDNSPLKW